VEIPAREQLEPALLASLSPYRGSLEAAFVHGSVVRGDFWENQSDIDLMIIGKHGVTPLNAAEAVKKLPVYGQLLEPHPCPMEQVEGELGRDFEGRTWD
jgi:predicted nucleotidyltransferase